MGHSLMTYQIVRFSCDTSDSLRSVSRPLRVSNGRNDPRLGCLRGRGSFYWREVAAFVGKRATSCARIPSSFAAIQSCRPAFFFVLQPKQAAVTV